MYLTKIIMFSEQKGYDEKYGKDRNLDNYEDRAIKATENVL